MTKDVYCIFTLSFDKSQAHIVISLPPSMHMADSSHAHTHSCIAVTLSPPQHLAAAKDVDNDSLRRYSWTADALDNVNLVSSPIHSG